MKKEISSSVRDSQKNLLSLEKLRNLKIAEKKKRVETSWELFDNVNQLQMARNRQGAGS